jgi:hypothetical protein
MPAFLSDEWLDELDRRGRELPSCEAATIVCQHEISGAPEGKVRFYVVWDQGRLVEVAKGKHASPDCSLSASAADALSVLSGETEAEVAFMQGRLKVEGDYRLWMVDLAAWRAGEPMARLCRELAELTD